MNQKYVLIVIIFMTSSCSYINKYFDKNERNENLNFQQLPKFNRTEYIKQIGHYKEFVLNDKEIKIVKLNSESEKYLEQITNKIVTSNELFFNRNKKANFVIFEDARPFYFSTPLGDIFLSTKLISKYLKNEHMLTAIISFELVRMEKLIYRKNIIAPTGYMSLERLFYLLRIDTESRIKLHKWAYYIMKRSGYDSSIYLNWIQLQNRNALEFKPMYGEVTLLSKEEAQFKGFLIRKDKNIMNEESKIQSSKRFFNFVHGFERKINET